MSWNKRDFVISKYSELFVKFGKYRLDVIRKIHVFIGNSIGVSWEVQRVQNLNWLILWPDNSLQQKPELHVLDRENLAIKLEHLEQLWGMNAFNWKL